jgi:hypothetical protein
MPYFGSRTWKITTEQALFLVPGDAHIAVIFAIGWTKGYDIERLKVSLKKYSG